jgi:hypothetical protein
MIKIILGVTIALCVLFSYSVCESAKIADSYKEKIDD